MALHYKYMRKKFVCVCVCVFQEGKDPTQLELPTGNVVCFSGVPLFTLGIRGPGRLASEREVEFFTSVKRRSGYMDQQSKLVLIKSIERQAISTI